MQAVLDFRNVSKHFGTLIANDDISFSLGRGEVLALLGENGAGKTTLMNILFGHYQADKGDILIDGKPLPPGSTQTAIAAGLGMVHQHFTLADNLTVLENIVVGTQPLWSGWLDLTAARNKLAKIGADYGLHIDADARVSNLSVGERQRVEILKALFRDCRILILDEPTAVLTPQEAQQLFTTLKKMVAQGLSVIFISHKLHEIMAISHRVVVLRRGAVVSSVATQDTNAGQLAELMVGRAVERSKPQAMAAGKLVVNIKDVSSHGYGPTRLEKIDLKIHAHEIVGIAGVAGNGQSTLADILSGVATDYGGAISINGVPLPEGDPQAIVALGAGRIPEDRHQRGVIGDFAIWENLIAEDIKSAPIAKAKTVINKSAALQRARAQIEQFDIRCEGPEVETKLLSGGNIQKLILARVLSPNPRFILANQPVRGLDEGAISFIQLQLLAARERGAAILLISEDLDELIALCDRLAVICDGRLSAALPPQDRTITELGLMMAGQSPTSAKRA